MKVKIFYLCMMVLAIIVAAIAQWLSKQYDYAINWTAVGICATAFVAIWQLRENSSQKALDRELETKREVLLEGVRAMSLATQAFSALPNLAISSGDSIRLFQTAAAQVTVAASVASLSVAKAGKKYMDTIGPKMIEALKMRVEIDRMDKSDPSFLEKHTEMTCYILENTIEISKCMLGAIAAVRTDIGIAKESEKEFLNAVYPDEELLRSVMDKVFDRESGAN